MRKLGQIREQLDNLHQLFVEERNKCQDLEVQLERLKGKNNNSSNSGEKPRREAWSSAANNTPRLNERLLRSSEGDKVLTWLTSFDEGGGGEAGAGVVERHRSPRKTWALRDPMGSLSRDKVIEQWLCLQQGEKESIADYSERFWKLRLEIQAVQSLSSEEQLRRYVAGLKFQLRNEVIALRPNSLSDAIAFAEKAEARSLVKARPSRPKSRRLPRNPGKSAEPPRKRPAQFQSLTPAQQFQYLSIHGACSCRKEDAGTGDRK